jgi:hypothetical protein
MIARRLPTYSAHLPSTHMHKARRGSRLLGAVAAVAIVCMSAQQASAQIALGGFGRAVGGVAINAEGVLANAAQGEVDKLRDLRLKGMADTPDDLAEPNEQRKVSLRGIVAALAECRNKDLNIPEEIQFLAGLQRIRYVLVYPEQQDIVLVGYGEGWKVGETGEYVGVKTGRPVLLLDDLLVALQTATAAAKGGITCSIDPTPEGIQRLRRLEAEHRAAGVDRAQTVKLMADAVGPQVVTLEGVPPTSHFARVMVAADYRMKRFQMGFEPVPITGLKSYLEMIKSGARQQVSPRFWMTTNYDALLTDADGLAWELRGRGVKTMTEDAMFAKDGERKTTGKANPIAKKWADTMTAKYDELAVREPIFGQLRNCMDMAVIGALIVKEGLAQKAGCDLSSLTDPLTSPVVQFAAPKLINSETSVREIDGDWITSTSGGVQINSWHVADRKEKSDTLAPVREKAARGKQTGWRWN